MWLCVQRLQRSTVLVRRFFVPKKSPALKGLKHAIQLCGVPLIKQLQFTAQMVVNCDTPNKSNEVFRGTLVTTRLNGDIGDHAKEKFGSRIVL